MPARPPLSPAEDEPLGLAWDAGADDGWGEPLETGDADGAVPPGAARPQGPPPDECGRRWGALGGALARLDACWADLPAPLQAGLLERVAWHEAVAAVSADRRAGWRDALALWLWDQGLGPGLALGGRGAWEQGLEDADLLRSARGLARGLAGCATLGGAADLDPEAAEARLGGLGMGVPAPEDTAAADPADDRRTPGLDAAAYGRWRDSLLADAAAAASHPLAAWIDAACRWADGSDDRRRPPLAGIWLLGTCFLRARGVLRAAPLPLWAGPPPAARRLRRRPLEAAGGGAEAGHPVATTALWLLSGIAAASRTHLLLLDRLRAGDAAARAWIAGRRAGGAAGPLWDLLLAAPAVSALRAAERLRITPQAATRVLLAMHHAGLVREVSGRESWRVWAIAAA